MARTLIDIDEDQLAAAWELGTKTKVDTVNAALAVVAERRHGEVFDDPLVWGSPELADPDIRGGRTPVTNPSTGIQQGSPAGLYLVDTSAIARVTMRRSVPN